MKDRAMGDECFNCQYNMRTLHRLCLQIKRVMRINQVDLITKAVIDAARQALIIGL